MSDQDEPTYTTEAVTLRQFMLGLHPYIVIEAHNVEGELVLKIYADGHENPDHIGYLPVLMLTELPAESNPLTEAAQIVLSEYPQDREALSRFASYVGFPMPDAES